jgi:hypothetical protein
VFLRRPIWVLADSVANKMPHGPTLIPPHINGMMFAEFILVFLAIFSFIEQRKVPGWNIVLSLVTGALAVLGFKQGDYALATLVGFWSIRTIIYWYDAKFFTHKNRRRASYANSRQWSSESRMSRMFGSNNTLN